MRRRLNDSVAPKHLLDIIFLPVLPSNRAKPDSASFLEVFIGNHPVTVSDFHFFSGKE